MQEDLKRGIQPGDVIIAPGRHVMIVRPGYTRNDQTDNRLSVQGASGPGAFRPLAAECVRVTTATEIPEELCGGRCRPGDLPASLRGSARPGFTVACDCTRPWGNGVRVQTPCCNRERRIARDGSERMICCPGCRWYWRIVLSDGAATRWISYGFGKALRRRTFGRKA